jgi:hypothetical protein
MARGKKPTAAEVVQWLLDNEHHYGAAVGGGLYLRGAKASITIPPEVGVLDVYRPSHFDVTKRMFEPTEAGLALLSGGASA